MNIEHVQQQIDKCQDSVVKAKIQTYLINFQKGRPEGYSLHFHFTARSLEHQLRCLFNPSDFMSFINICKGLVGVPEEEVEYLDKIYPFIDVALGESTIIGDGRKWVCPTGDFEVVDEMLEYIPNYSYSELANKVGYRFRIRDSYLTSYKRDLEQYFGVGVNISDTDFFLRSVEEVLRGLHIPKSGYSSSKLLRLYNYFSQTEELEGEDLIEYVKDYFEGILTSHNDYRIGYRLLLKYRLRERYDPFFLDPEYVYRHHVGLTLSQYGSNYEPQDLKSDYDTRIPFPMDNSDLKDPIDGIMDREGRFYCVGKMQHESESYYIVKNRGWESDMQQLGLRSYEEFLKNEKGFVFFATSGFINPDHLRFYESISDKQFKEITRWLIRSGLESITCLITTGGSERKLDSLSLHSRIQQTK